MEPSKENLPTPEEVERQSREREKAGMAPDSASEKKKQETTPEEAAQDPDANEKPDPEVP